METAGSAKSEFFRSLEEQERKGKAVFLTLAVLGTVWAVILAFTEYRMYLAPSYFTMIFFDDTEEAVRLVGRLFAVTTVAAPLLQTALFAAAYFGKGWARAALAIYFALNSFSAVLFLFPMLSLMASDGLSVYWLMGLVLILAYCLPSCVLLLRNQPVRAYMYARRTKRAARRTEYDG